MLFCGQLLIKQIVISQELLLRFISNFHQVLVLTRAFQKYYGLLSDFLLTSGFFAFLSKFKPYSAQQRAISFMKYQKSGMKDILFRNFEHFWCLNVVLLFQCFNMCCMYHVRISLNRDIHRILKVVSIFKNAAALLYLEIQGIQRIP